MSEKAWCYYRINETCVIKIDTEDLDKVSTKKWTVSVIDSGFIKIFYRFKMNGKIYQTGLGRLLVDCPPDKVVCVWKDKFDFRKSNLLICNLSEKQHHYKKNGAKSGRKTSTYPGVSWDRLAMKWRASICKNGKSIYLGIFNNETDAATAYLEFSEKYFSIESKKAG